MDDAYDEVRAQTDAEIAQATIADGGDPAAIGARGAALASALLARRQRLAWQSDRRAELDAARDRIRGIGGGPKLPRAELIARIAAARNDARFGAVITAAFRKGGADAATDDEFAELLVEIEMLAALKSPEGPKNDE